MVIKHSLLIVDIRNKIKSTDYIDSENPEIPKQKKNPPFFQFYKGASFEYLKEKEKIRNQKSCILKICVFPCLRGKYEGVAF